MTPLSVSKHARLLAILAVLSLPNALSADHLPDSKLARGNDELMLAGIEIYKTSLSTVFRKLGKPAVKPFTFVRSPQSPFYPEMEKAVGANLDYIISTQESDGGWGLTWSWKDRNSTAWKLAEKEWRGVVSLENLQTLQASHRIAQ